MLESRADTDARRIVKPTPERERLVYTVNEPACVMADQVVAPVTAPSVGLGDIKALLRRLLPTAPVQTPPPRPVPTEMEILMVRLLLNAPASDRKYGKGNLATTTASGSSDAGTAAMPSACCV